MQKLILFILLGGLFAVTTNSAFSQEVSLATFQETAQVLVDKSNTKDISASITLQTTSIQEMRIPSELEKKIRENNQIASIILTNQEQCVLGVSNESCILINVKRNASDKGISEIQESTKETAELFIDEINQTFDTKAEFHSVFIHTDDEFNKALQTSGVVSGSGTISAVYTMPMEDSDSMYEKISSLLIPKVIRDSGGFYETATALALEENSKVTFSIIPFDNNSLLQLKLSVDYPEAATNLTEIEPLKFLGTENLKRSDYFSSGFYPLNSIIQVVILSNEPSQVSNLKGNLIPTQVIDGERIPTELDKEGWVFDPEAGERIQGKYIFGKETSVNGDDLLFSVGTQENSPPVETTFDESIIILIIIIVGGIGATVFFLKGYKK